MTNPTTARTRRSRGSKLGQCRIFHHRFPERNSVGGFIQSGMGEEQIAIMSMSREHRHRAEDCLRLANETNELFAKMALLEMAAEFRARAQQLELRERRSRQRSAAIK